MTIRWIRVIRSRFWRGEHERRDRGSLGHYFNDPAAKRLLTECELRNLTHRLSDQADKASFEMHETGCFFMRDSRKERRKCNVSSALLPHQVISTIRENFHLVIVFDCACTASHEHRQKEVTKRNVRKSLFLPLLNSSVKEYSFIINHLISSFVQYTFL